MGSDIMHSSTYCSLAFPKIWHGDGSTKFYNDSRQWEGDQKAQCSANPAEINL